MAQPTTTSSAESRNGTRQPQERKSSSLCSPAISASTPAESRLPAATPASAPTATRTHRAPPPRRAAGLRPARPEAAPGAVAMLGGHQHRPAPLAADREALHEAEPAQQHPRPDAAPGSGRTAAAQ